MSRSGRRHTLFRMKQLTLQLEPQPMKRPSDARIHPWETRTRRRAKARKETPMIPVTESDTSQLIARAQAIASRAASALQHRTAMVGEASRELQQAATWHLHRAAVPGSRDNQVYAHGSAEQALGALDLCPIAMLGLKAAGSLAYPWLIEASESLPHGSLLDHARLVLEHPDRRRFLVELGSWHRFQWKRSVYQREVQDWNEKPIARDPLARWRRRSVTPKQAYLATLISECLAARDPELSEPCLTNRGQAHDWLREKGGHPMFWNPPIKKIA